MGEFTASPDPPAGFGGHFAEGGGLHGLGSTAGLGEEEEMEVKGRKERKGRGTPSYCFPTCVGSQSLATCTPLHISAPICSL
jgi:hypothetical protein